MAALNALVIVLMVGTGLSARPADRFVYAVFPPWLDPAEVRARISSAGARSVDEAARFIVRIAVPDPASQVRLMASGALMILTAAPPAICAAPRGAAP